MNVLVKLGQEDRHLIVHVVMLFDHTSTFLSSAVHIHLKRMRKNTMKWLRVYIV